MIKPPMHCSRCGVIFPHGHRHRCRFTPVERLHFLREAVHDLKFAQEHARLAGAPYTLLKIKAARRSLEGAIRHAEGRVSHPQRAFEVRRVKRLRNAQRGSHDQP